MPLVKRHIPLDLDIVRDDLYMQSQGNQVFQDVEQASFLGTMKQISLLSQFAAEIFKGILQVSEVANDKIVNISSRSTQVLEALLEGEKQVKENRSNFDFDFNTAKLQHSEASTQLFHSESQGIALKFQYDAIKFHEPALYIKNKEEQAKRDKVSKTPDFVGLNKLLDINLMNPDVLVRMKSSNLLNGQGVVQTQRGWSFPEYFIEKWVQQESERQKARKEERKKRKEAKKRRMEQFPTQEKRVSASSKRATKGTWQDQYSSEIGIQNVKSKRRVTSQRNMVVTSSGAVDESTGVKSFHTQKVKFLATEEGDEDEDVASPQLLGRKKPPPPPKPAPIPASDSTQSRTSPVQEVPETSSTKREEVESGGDVAAAVPEEYEQFQKMLTVGLPEPMVIGKIMQAGLDPSVLGLGGDGNKKPPAPPGKPKAPPGKPPGKPNGPRPAPPPKKETLGGGGRPAMGGLLGQINAGKALKKRADDTPADDTPARSAAPAPGGFLAAIKGGVNLKKAAPAPPPEKKPSGNSMLAAIQGGVKLKKAAAREEKPKVVEESGMFQGDTVAKLLAIRKNVQVDSDSDDSDDNWDSDDD